MVAGEFGEVEGVDGCHIGALTMATFWPCPFEKKRPDEVKLVQGGVGGIAIKRCLCENY